MTFPGPTPSPSPVAALAPPVVRQEPGKEGF